MLLKSVWTLWHLNANWNKKKAEEEEEKKLKYRHTFSQPLGC